MILNNSYLKDADALLSSTVKDTQGSIGSEFGLNSKLSFNSLENSKSQASDEGSINPKIVGIKRPNISLDNLGDGAKVLLSNEEEWNE